tara:strand:+ start:81 stop:530 length:450 start_codon:yes stop_codon:yes gene_type:complete
MDKLVTNKSEDIDKLNFRRTILLMVLMSILSELIPSFLNFEKYYGLSRFIDQGYISLYLDVKLELYITVFMSFLSMTSLIFIYFFIPIGKYFFLTYILLNFFLIMFSGDIINYGFLYPIQWWKNVIEAYLLYLMFFGSCKNNFKIRKFN